MSKEYTYKFRIKNLNPRAKTVLRKEVEVVAGSHAEACDRLDREMVATFWHPDAFLGSDDPDAPGPLYVNGDKKPLTP